MIGDNDKDGFGAGRLLKALPDPAPRHPAWGKELAPNLLHFHLPELWEIHLPMTLALATDSPVALAQLSTGIDALVAPCRSAPIRSGAPTGTKWGAKKRLPPKGRTTLDVLWHRLHEQSRQARS